MKKIYVSFLVLTLTFLNLNSLAQITPQDSPYYQDGPFTVISETLTDAAPDLLTFRPDASGQQFPVLIFQPGANAQGASDIDVNTYNIYLEHLASYGYVVVIIDNTAGGPNGTIFSETLDRVLAFAADNGHWMSELADTDNIAVAGHSNGGINATDLIIERPNDIKSIIYMASYPNPGIFGLLEQNVADYPGNVLLMIGDEDETSSPFAGTTNEEALTAYNDRFTSAECKTFVELVGVGHGGFGDYQHNEHTVGTIGRDDVTASIRHYLVSFMEYYHKDNGTAEEELKIEAKQPNSTGEFLTNCPLTLPLPQPVIENEGALTFCAGDSVLLYVDTEYDVLWSTGSTDDTLVVTEAGTYTVQLISGQQESDPSEPVTVVVNEGEDASWDAPGTVCESEGVVDLTTFITGDTGGTWGGNGVTNGTFDPTGLAGQEVTITYMHNTQCPDEVINTITVIGSPDASWTATGVICSETEVDLMDWVTGNSGGTWSGNGVANNSWNTAGLSGTIDLTYSVGSGSCLGESTQSVEVTTQSDASWEAPASICETEGALDLTTFVTGDAGGVWAGNGVSNGSFDPAGLGGEEVVITYMHNTQCMDEVLDTISVIAVSDASWEADVVCAGDEVELADWVVGDEEGTWSGNGVNGDVWNTSGLSGMVELTYSVGTGTCSDELVQEVEVINLEGVEVVESNGVLSSSVEGDDYQWYLNGNAIPDANDQSYTPTETGDYSVEVSSGDCDAESEEYPFEVVSTDSYFKSSISIYPNPASENVVITMDASHVSALNIVTLQGAVVKSHTASNTMQLDVAEFERGIYLINFISNEGVTLYTSKLVID